MRKLNICKSLADLLQGLGSETKIKNLSPHSQSFSSVFIRDLTLDSRACKPGSLFFALQGSKQDGHTFILEAIKNGCSAVFCEYALPLFLNQKNISQISIPILVIPDLREKIGLLTNQFFPLKSHIKLIGVTGTNGKTSVTHFIAQALNYLNHPCGLIGTLGPHKGSNALTTPDRFELGRLLCELPPTVAMEVSSHALDQNRVADLPFQMAIFTNFSQDHLDYHKTLEAYAKAKAKLFVLPSLKFAVLNQDDGYFDFFKKTLQSNISNISKIKIFTYSLSSLASHKADIFLISYLKEHISIHTPLGEIEAEIQLWGEFNFSNILATVGALIHLGYTRSEIQSSLAILTPPKGRLEKIILANQATAIIDYAHTPDALEKVLIALKKHTQKKIICLFGCGGDRDRSKRPKMAAIAEKYASFVILTEDNSRFEDPEQIFHEINQGFSASFKKSDNYKIIPSRAQAIQAACDMAELGDVILLAGKGHETYLDIQGQKLNFDERDFLA